MDPARQEATFPEFEDKETFDAVEYGIKLLMMALLALHDAEVGVFPALSPMS